MSRNRKTAGEVTIYDVARLAGVSPASVSRVLNQVRVRPEIQAKVEKAVAKLGFRRNLLASALTTKKTGTAGLLVPDVRNPFYAEVVQAVEDAARSVGYSTVICNTLDDPWRQREYLHLLRSKGADGVIALTHSSVDTFLVELYSEGYPVVLMDRGSTADPRVCVVGVDNAAGGRMAVRHLLESGHIHIAVLAEAPHWPGSLERVQGCEAEVAARGLSHPLTVVYSDHSTIAGGMAACRKALTINPSITAVVGGNDLLAIGAMLVAKESGRQVPERFSVVGFDGTALSHAVEPPLTTVAQPVAEMCTIAVEWLVAQIDGRLTEPMCRVFSPTLVLGRSSGPASQA